MRWVKIFTWRGNGDGINPFSNGLIEDCFIRTQDDSTYVNGRGIRRVVYWQDCNGSTFVMSPIGAVLPDALPICNTYIDIYSQKSNQRLEIIKL